MIYSDFVNGSGIYQILAKNENFKLPIFNQITTPVNLDNSFMFHNGNKEVCEGITDLTTAASILMVDFYNKWDNYIKTVLNSSALLGGGNSTVSKQSGTITNANQVSAYDSEEFVNDSQTTQTNNITNSTTATSISDLQELLTLYNNNEVYDIINMDIRKTLFGSVY